MAFKRYKATADNTITNAFNSTFSLRGTGSNMGASDVIEVFSIYGQQSTASVELARSLVQFSTSKIATDRTAGEIPSSGNVKFFLKLFNAEHSQTVPKNYYLLVTAVSRSWTEGIGLDMENYSDKDVCNWEKSETAVTWSAEGGDYHALPRYKQYFDKGTENLDVDVTDMVEQWLAGTKSNYGFGIQLTSSLEDATRSYYTKKFFARGSQYELKVPVLEARWDSTVGDRRDVFYASSSLAPAADNLNHLYIYNRIRGRLVNFPTVGTGSIFVSLFSGSSKPVGSALTLSDGTTIATGSHFSTGIYKASVALDTTCSYLYDVWSDTSHRVLTTGSQITVRTFDSDVQAGVGDYVTSITNMKPSYSPKEKTRFRLYIRDRDWCPTIYTVANKNIQSEIIENGFYKIFRIVDGEEVVGYGTGSLNHTRMSYDRESNYFDFDMSNLPSGYSYAIKFLYKFEDRLEEQRETFKFRVD
tara:strand:- start:1028 stop:2443 length:1416 start_codon:yes stop_codon:yes gene_type:complete